MGACVFRIILAAMLAILVGAGQALAEGRVALIIGNAAYSSVAPLANPVNDATDLAAALTRIGFDVSLATNLDGGDMRNALRAFRDKADGAEMAMIYFAGHGIEIDNQNYLIPVDANLRSDSDVLFDTIPLDLLNEAVSRAKTLRMVLVDACRNNPFLGQIEVADSSRSIGRGLSPFEPTGGTLVAFAAKGGTVALDGNGRNSPFMKGLLAHLEQPGLDVNLMFRKVRDSVLQETSNRQEPFTYGSLPGREIYLVPPAVTEVAAVSPVDEPAAPAAQSPAAGSAEEEFAWSLVRNSTDPAQVQTFIRTFPQGIHVAEAFALLDSLRNSAPSPAPVQPPAETVVADLPATRVVPPTEPEDDTNLIVALQVELQRAGCNPGPADGIWGRRSEAAVRAFAHDGELAIGSTAPSQNLLGILRSVPGRVCVQQAAAPQTSAPRNRSTSTPAQQPQQQQAQPQQPQQQKSAPTVVIVPFPTPGGLPGGLPSGLPCAILNC